jgi:phospholipase/carboxylesterase
MSETALRNFHHIFVDNQADQTLFLLHGTGGNQHDLLPLVMSVSDEFNFVGLLGNVEEAGLARFFRRTEPGVFDQENIKQETEKLAEFIKSWKRVNKTSTSDFTFLGYSNGANMILATMFYFPKLIRRAVLLHPMLPFEPAVDLNLTKAQVLVTYGLQDAMAPLAASKQVISTLQQRGADLTIVEHSGGHEIRTVEIEAMESFLRAVH